LLALPPECTNVKAETTDHRQGSSVVRHLASLAKDKSEGYDLVPATFEDLAVGETTQRR